MKTLRAKLAEIIDEQPLTSAMKENLTDDVLSLFESEPVGVVELNSTRDRRDGPVIWIEPQFSELQDGDKLFVIKKENRDEC